MIECRTISPCRFSSGHQSSNIRQVNNTPPQYSNIRFTISPLPTITKCPCPFYRDRGINYYKWLIILIIRANRQQTFSWCLLYLLSTCITATCCPHAGSSAALFDRHHPLHNLHHTTVIPVVILSTIMPLPPTTPPSKTSHHYPLHPPPLQLTHCIVRLSDKM